MGEKRLVYIVVVTCIVTLILSGGFMTLAFVGMVHYPQYSDNIDLIHEGNCTIDSKEVGSYLYHRYEYDRCEFFVSVDEHDHVAAIDGDVGIRGMIADYDEAVEVCDDYDIGEEVPCAWNEVSDVFNYEQTKLVYLNFEEFKDKRSKGLSFVIPGWVGFGFTIIIAVIICCCASHLD